MTTKLIFKWNFYLGVTTDQHSDGRRSFVILFSNKFLYIEFCNWRNVLDTTLIRVAYFVFTQSVLQYCIFAWEAAFHNVLSTIQILQNIIIKIKSKKNKYYQAVVLCNKSFNLLTTKQL